ncbi:flagellar hook-length control protein FliK [Alphaproteobacteria bacterium]|jgi:flagellar hook-length control protein FliK|nr:flagellar hook-length control protein FliK [Alphaproteobacteria bacterium]MDC1036686.1 flagellar hook-length control protein FliK [Alphaproteobacteria bacterium]
MSKIVPKSVQIAGASGKSPVSVNAEKTGRDLLFTALFDGAATDGSIKDIAMDATTVAGALAGQSQDQDDAKGEPQEELLAMIVAQQAASKLQQKSSGQPTIDADDVVATDGEEFLHEDENANALADIIGSMPLNTNGYVGMANDDDAAKIETGNFLSANTASEESKLLGSTDEKFLKIRLSLDRGQGTAGQGETPGSTPSIKTGRDIALANVKFDGTTVAAAAPGKNTAGQAKLLENFIGPLPAQSADGKLAAKFANLMKNRSLDLEQRDAEIDAELFGDKANEFIGKKEKNLVSGASLKQAMLSAQNLAFGDKLSMHSAQSQNVVELMRASQSASAMLDTVSGIAGQSGGHSHSGGQSGSQNGGQSGSIAGGGLLNNLNMLQTLDMAKNNWSEMLLQRVQRGLAGGKDQLEFQLNPRNLGKMRISLVMKNNRANVLIKTETSVAASMLNDAEGRLAQMLEASGIRLGSLDSGQSQGFGGNASDGQANQQNTAETPHKAIAGKTENDGPANAEMTTERSENLINIQA